MPGVFPLAPFPFVSDPNAQAVHSNATITASGSQIFNGFGASQLTLVVNILNAPTGTTPTITFTIQEVDPGNLTTVFGNAVSTTTINAAGIQAISLNTTAGAIKVSWVVTGTTPSFTGVYVTLSQKQAGGVNNSSSTSYAAVTATTTATTILAANALRKGATITNRSNKDLYLMLGTTTPSSSAYTALLAKDDYYEIPFNYTGIIKGVWATASPTNDAQVVEFT